MFNVYLCTKKKQNNIINIGSMKVILWFVREYPTVFIESQIPQFMMFGHDDGVEVPCMEFADFQ